MVNSRKYMHVTYSQIDKMKHTIGFDPRKVTGTKHRKYVPYRNYYAAGGFDLELEDLVALGFMARNDAMEKYVCYHVTEDGRIFLERVTGVKILPESH